MAFNDLSFVFLFFPAALVLHGIMPRVGKNLVLLALSLVFFAWGSGEYVVLMLLSILFNYFTGLQMQDRKKAGDRKFLTFTLVSAVAVNLLLLGFFKYWGFVISNVNAIFGASFTVPELPMPLGVSFFTFSILSYLFDVYRGKTAAAKNILNFALYVTFFPKLVSGPIVQYADFTAQLGRRKLNLTRFGKGSRLFIIGLAKKVILSNNLGTTFYALSALEPGSLSAAAAWLGAVCYALMLYFDFSGYSDMAIGLAEMFGFSFRKNFDYPYLSGSITEFWRRWHISLGAWFRDYVYIPLGGSRVGTLKNIRNLFVVWALTGIWHGASWNFVVWGLYYGVLLLLEKYVFKTILGKIPALLRHAGTLLLVLIGWVFFFSPDLGSAFAWLGAMLGRTAPVDSVALYHLAGSWILVLIAAVSAFPLGARLGGRIYRQGRAAVLASLIWFVLLLVVCIAGMMSSTYSSFLYFQF